MMIQLPGEMSFEGDVSETKVLLSAKQLEVLPRDKVFLFSRMSTGTAISTDITPDVVTSTVNQSIINSKSIYNADELSEPSSSLDSPSFEDADLLNSSNVADVTAQLAAAGPIGMAAAAAIATAKKRKRPHSFETNPSIRKRQQTRLLRKLKATIDEYTIRVGQQAIVLVVTPGKPQNNFKVFGAHPLENVVRSCKSVIMQELENALAQQAPPQTQDDPTLHELPPLVIDGIPTPVEKMTQAQLRTFIPLMLKYSTGRGKPGWGRESTRPAWWPKELPWANVRSDARTDEDKQKVSWTHALRQIVINCYKYHGREDLLPAFSNDDDKEKKAIIPTVSAIETLAGAQGTLYAQPLTAHYPTMVQTISNPDGTVSLIQVDPANTVVTLPDGTQAQLRTVSAVRVLGQQADGELTAGTHQVNGQTVTPVSIDLNGEAGAQAVATLAEATINQDGQIILTGEDGTQSAFPVSGMVSIPVSMYQTVVANISQLTDVQAHGIQVAMAPIVTESNATEVSVSATSSEENVSVLTTVTSSSSVQATEQSDEI
ncbi:DNA-binding protein P3A2 isoform X1 [Parasteatoda tepidariorum]|uniref:DNA-binding protein P3A2 isoform X1 n=4 Tax=Parasteatoda tepidariorum TaxID=114398 RepID=UPI00077FA677|nr:DNA-binding protein P3A2 isoform X1 [Parasteatoda tepidariorum]